MKNANVMSSSYKNVFVKSLYLEAPESSQKATTVKIIVKAIIALEMQTHDVYFTETISALITDNFIL